MLNSNLKNKFFIIFINIIVFFFFIFIFYYLNENMLVYAEEQRPPIPHLHKYHPHFKKNLEIWHTFLAQMCDLSLFVANQVEPNFVTQTSFLLMETMTLASNYDQAIEEKTATEIADSVIRTMLNAWIAQGDEQSELYQYWLDHVYEANRFEK